MSVPTLVSIGGLHRLKWSDEQVVMHVERLHENSHFEVSGEVQINTTAAGSPSHLHGGSRLNLTSVESRRRLAKYLNEDVMPNNWISMLEQAAVMVLAEWRKGSPAIELAKHQPREALRMRVSPLLQERQPTVFYGDGETLKSFLALFIAVLVKTGETQAGLSPEPGNVLYLDYETDEDTMWQRAQMIALGLGLPIPEGLHYRHMEQQLAADVQQLNRLVLDLGIDFVVVDSAAPAVLEPESASMTTEYFRALRSLRVTTLTIAHVAKNTKQKSPFGSAFWVNLPRATFHITVDREADPKIVVGLKHTKSNNGRRLSAIGLEFAFEEDRICVERVNPSDIPGLAPGLSPSERIATALSRGGLPVQELFEQLSDLSESHIRATLSRNGLFTQISRGVWGLKAKE